MKAIAKKLVDEINELLELSATFNDRYAKGTDDNIGTDLYEDFLYFYTRVGFIFKSIKKDTIDGKLKRFYLHHIRIAKNPIDGIEETVIEINAGLKVAKREIENGLLYQVSDLIEAEVFSDFLEYAKYLLDKGFIHSVPVIVGSVLEHELRSILEKNQLPTKTDKGKNLTLEPMNENVGKAGIYDMKVQKRITALAQIRNDAAHGDYDKFTKEDVEDMYKYVLNFDY